MEGSRFMVDYNAGKLARWLRMTGYDTAYFREGSDAQMLEKARVEDRIVLTRDTSIIKRKLVTGGSVKALLLKDDDPKKQFRQVAEDLKLDYFYKPLSLCLGCNEPLAPASPEEVRGKVPPYVFNRHTQFFCCPRCSSVYWAGSHKKAIEDKLKMLAEEENK